MREAAVTIVNWLPLLAANPLIRLRLSVPSSAADPVTASWSYWVPAVVPPISILSEPAEVCVKLPAIVNVPAPLLPGLVAPELKTFAWIVLSPERVPPNSCSVPPTIVPVLAALTSTRVRLTVPLLSDDGAAVGGLERGVVVGIREQFGQLREVDGAGGAVGGAVGGEAGHPPV